MGTQAATGKNLKSENCEGICNYEETSKKLNKMDSNRLLYYKLTVKEIKVVPE
jgi:hypothetical protein